MKVLVVVFLCAEDSLECWQHLESGGFPRGIKNEHNRRGRAQVGRDKIYVHTLDGGGTHDDVCWECLKVMVFF